VSAGFLRLIRSWATTGRPIQAVAVAWSLFWFTQGGTASAADRDELRPWGAVSESYGAALIADNKTVLQMAQVYSLEGRLPVDRAEGLFETTFSTRRAQLQTDPWVQREFWWAPTEFSHWPVYFDDVPLESYGQTTSRVLQPALSGAHFFGDIVLLPYSMLADRPLQRVSQLGEYRPGSCAPPLREGVRCLR
jgi:hypothetical protein